LPGKATASHDVALETAPVAGIEYDAKSIPDTADNIQDRLRLEQL